MKKQLFTNKGIIEKDLLAEEMISMSEYDQDVRKELAKEELSKVSTTEERLAIIESFLGLK